MDQAHKALTTAEELRQATREANEARGDLARERAALVRDFKVAGSLTVEQYGAVVREKIMADIEGAFKAIADAREDVIEEFDRANKEVKRLNGLVTSTIASLAGMKSAQDIIDMVVHTSLAQTREAIAEGMTGLIEEEVRKRLNDARRNANRKGRH